MKKNSILKKFFFGIGLFSAVGLQAQEFPAFQNVTPEGTPSIFRGNVIWGDYNNDGKQEAFAMGRSTSDGWPTFLFQLKDNGANGLQRFDITGIPYNMVYNAVLAWIDYNNDGNLDLLYMGTAGGNEDSDSSDHVFIQLYKNTGAAGGYAFELVENVGDLLGVYIEQEGNYAGSIAIGDYDNDGYTDILMTGKRDGDRHVDLYKNDKGTGRFVLQSAPLGERPNLEPFKPQNSGSVAFADFNNDGWLDIIVNGYNDVAKNGFVNMYINNTDGTFRDNYISYDILVHSSDGQIGVADLDGDGNLDFVVTGQTWPAEGSSRRVFDLYYHQEVNDQGEVLFKGVDSDEVFIDKVWKSSVDFCDFNSDGKLDIVVAGEAPGTTARTSIYMKKDDGTYASEHDVLGRIRSGAIIALGDFNGDGYIDAASMGYSDFDPYFNAYRNTGNLKLNTPPTAPVNLRSSYTNGLMTFSWDAGTDAETPVSALRYNFYIKKANGEVYTLIPADVATGNLKVSDHTIALTRTTVSLQIENGDYEWGVQTIDQGKRGSKFTKYNASSINNTIVNEALNAYAANGQLYVTTGNEMVTVTVYDTAGKQVNRFENVTDGPVTSLGKGVYIVKLEVAKASKAVKIVM